MLIAVNYHYVRPAFDLPYPGIHGVTVEQFTAQLELLSRAGTFVSADQIERAIDGGGDLPARAIVITFDDGLREQYEHAWPVLRRMGVPAIFFLNTRPIAAASVSPVHKIHLLRANVSPPTFLERLSAKAHRRGISLPTEVSDRQAVSHYKYDDPPTARLKYMLNFSLRPADRDAVIDEMFAEFAADGEAEVSRRLYMDPNQVAELGRHRCLGSHAHEHLPLGQLVDGQIDQQVSRAAELLEQWGGYRPAAFSYPFGSPEACSPAVAQALARQGVRFAFTMERAGNATLERPLHLARFDNNDAPGGKSSPWQPENWFAAVGHRRWFADQ